MKHIFTIHSHVTFLVAYSTIEHLGLNREDVILLSSKYKVLIDGFNVKPSYQTKHQKLWDKLFTFNAPLSHDKYINQLTGGSDFVAYVDLMSYYQKVLVTHPKCREFHFIEEGNGAYQEVDDLVDITWPERQMHYRIKSYFSFDFYRSLIRVIRGYNLRLLSIPYNYMAFVNLANLKFYCFSGNSYFNAPIEKKVILRPKPNDEIQKMALGVALENEIIWIDGSNGRYTGLPESYYHQAIDKAIGILKSRGIYKKRIFIKLRPGENLEKNYLFKAISMSGAEVEVLPDYTVLEALFVTSKDCMVIGNLSAALEYAHCFGHKTYSIYSLFEKTAPTFFDRMTGFWQNTEMLKA
jgi:hypothetical protein